MKFLKMKEVCQLTGLSRATVYRLLAADNFPRQRQLSTRRVGWLAADIEKWAENRQSV